MILGALEHADRATQTEQVAVEPQREILSVVAARVRPTRDELPFLVDDLPVQHPRRHRGAVYIFEMRTVRRVLRHDLRMHRLTLRAPGELGVRPVIARRIRLELRELAKDIRHLPPRLLAVRLMPDEHAVVLLADGIDPQSQRTVGSLWLIRDVPIGPVRAPAPAVEGALDAVADDLAAVADVRTEVLAVCFQNVQLTGLVAIGDEVLAEVVQRPYLADGKFGGPPDHEPAGDFPGERNFHGGA